MKLRKWKELSDTEQMKVLLLLEFFCVFIAFGIGYMQGIRQTQEFYLDLIRNKCVFLAGLMGLY